MGLHISTSKSSKIKSVATLLVVAVLAVQPVSGFIASRVANAAPNTVYTDTGFGGLTWAADRITPSGGYTNSAGTLTMNVDGSKPNANQAFYKYEGLKAALPAGISSVRADLYVDPAWSTHDVIVGMWGQVGSNTSNSPAWPTLEFSNMNDSSRTATVDIFNTFTGNYDGVTNVAYGSTINLEIAVNKASGAFEYYLNNTLIFSQSNVSDSDVYDSFSHILFNNRNGGVSYQVKWSNLQTGTFKLATPSNLRLNGDKACGYATNVNFITPTWDAVSGADHYNYKVTLPNGSTYGPTNVGNVTSVSGAFGGQGLSTFSVQAVAADGTTSDWSTSCAVTYDAVAPSAPSALAWKTSSNKTIANNGYTNEVAGTAQWTASTSSDVDHYVYKYWNDIVGNGYKVGSEYLASTNGVSLPGSFNQGEGVHHICVQAVDHAGNTSACTEFMITYDKTKPVVSGSNEPAVNPTSFTITATDNIAVKSITGNVYKADANGNYTLYKSNSSSSANPFTVNLSNLGDGSYYVRYNASDGVNIASTKEFYFTVDHTAPVVTVTGATSNGNGTYTITGKSSDTAPVTVMVNLTSYTVTPDASSRVWTVTTGQLTAGTLYSVVANSTDAAGNQSAQMTPYTFTPPVATSTNNSQTNNNGTPAATTVTVGDNGRTIAPAAATGQQAEQLAFVGTDGTVTTDEPTVLGTQDTKTNETASDSSEQSVKGAEDSKSSNGAWSLLGFAWYWWLIALAAIAGIWWLIAARRRRSEEN